MTAGLSFSLSAAVVVIAAMWLAESGIRISTDMGWEASFMGTQFLAVSTSLPELATSVAAMRLGAPELAASNLLGSNLFNMGVVLFLDDLGLFPRSYLGSHIRDTCHDRNSWNPDDRHCDPRTGWPATGHSRQVLEDGFVFSDWAVRGCECHSVPTRLRVNMAR